MNKKIFIAGGAVVLVLAALIGITAWQNAPREANYGAYRLDTIVELAEQKEIRGNDVWGVLPASAASGGMAENIKGNPDAPVKIYEYADYQCEHCAALNPVLNQIVEDYDGKVAVVFRAYIMNYHQNGVISAAAANAAAKQGYWAEYKDLLFANQNDWYYESGTTLQKLLEGYFIQIAGDKGDLGQFRADMKSEVVAQKIAYDMAVSDKVNPQWTPSVYVGKTFVSQKKDDDTGYTQAEFLANIKKEIDKQLKVAS